MRIFGGLCFVVAGALSAMALATLDSDPAPEGVQYLVTFLIAVGGLLVALSD